MENSTFVTDTEMNQLCNTNLSWLYDMLVAASPPYYYSTDGTVSVVAGTTSYTLPADFRSLIQVFWQVSAGVYRPIYPIVDTNRESYQPPQVSGTVILRYVPAPPVLSTDSGATGTFDGVSGWDELIVMRMARDMLTKEESDVQWLDMKIAELVDRISRNAKGRSVGIPQQTQNFRGRSWKNSNYYPGVQSVNGFQLRAGNLDLFNYNYGWA